MFVQIVQGKAIDGVGLRRQWDAWLRDLAPGAVGWLGSTAGIAASGEFVAIARFDAQGSARRNAESPEQEQWWAETARCFDERPNVYDSSDVHLLLGGIPEEAGFVQIMQGRVLDRDRLLAIEADGAAQLRKLRPDMLGGIRAFHGDGCLTAVDYFSSETEAREGEQREMPPEMEARFKEWLSLWEDIRFLDLREPWLASAGRPGGS